MNLQELNRQMRKMMNTLDCRFQYKKTIKIPILIHALFYIESVCRSRKIDMICVDGEHEFLTSHGYSPNEPHYIEIENLLQDITTCLDQHKKTEPTLTYRLTSSNKDHVNLVLYHMGVIGDMSFTIDESSISITAKETKLKIDDDELYETLNNIIVGMEKKARIKNLYQYPKFHFNQWVRTTKVSALNYDFIYQSLCNSQLTPEDLEKKCALNEMDAKEISFRSPTTGIDRFIYTISPLGCLFIFTINERWFFEPDEYEEGKIQIENIISSHIHERFRKHYGKEK